MRDREGERDTHLTLVEPSTIQIKGTWPHHINNPALVEVQLDIVDHI